MFVSLIILIMYVGIGIGVAALGCHLGYIRERKTEYRSFYEYIDIETGEKFEDKPLSKKGKIYQYITLWPGIVFIRSFEITTRYLDKYITKCVDDLTKALDK
ncbi:MAG: hypothetical protein HRT61_01020 [Ekhidna sp.]|nr:hypothetical protein [Ekhidna sp.]